MLEVGQWLHYIFGAMLRKYEIGQTYKFSLKNNLSSSLGVTKDLYARSYIFWSLGGQGVSGGL